MDLRGLSGVLVVVGLGETAFAQEADPPARPPAASPHPDAGLGARFAVGEAVADGVGDAWVARLEYELYPVWARQHHPGPVYGFQVGAEYWRAGAGSSGFDLPTEVVAGARVFPVRLTLGAGVDAFLVDQVHGDTGVGLFAPLASASAGLDVGGYNLMAETRVTRRWQLGADDHTQWMFTLAFGRTLEAEPDRSSDHRAK